MHALERANIHRHIRGPEAHVGRGTVTTISTVDCRPIENRVGHTAAGGASTYRVGSEGRERGPRLSSPTATKALKKNQKEKRESDVRKAGGVERALLSKACPAAWREPGTPLRCDHVCGHVPLLEQGKQATHAGPCFLLAPQPGQPRQPARPGRCAGVARLFDSAFHRPVVDAARDSHCLFHHRSLCCAARLCELVCDLRANAPGSHQSSSQLSVLRCCTTRALIGNVACNHFLQITRAILEVLPRAEKCAEKHQLALCADTSKA